MSFCECSPARRRQVGAEQLLYDRGRGREGSNSKACRDRSITLGSWAPTFARAKMFQRRSSGACLTAAGDWGGRAKDWFWRKLEVKFTLQDAQKIFQLIDSLARIFYIWTCMVNGHIDTEIVNIISQTKSWQVPKVKNSWIHGVHGVLSCLIFDDSSGVIEGGSRQRGWSREGHK